MQDEQTSIFDKEFLQEISIRRRHLMPLALKIYVWFYIVFSVFIFTVTAFTNTIPKSPNGIDHQVVIGWCFGLIFPSFRILSHLFILFEKKHAILFAVLASAFTISCWAFFFFDATTITTGELVLVALTILEIPFLILLLRIKRAWETTH